MEIEVEENEREDKLEMGSVVEDTSERTDALGDLPDWHNMDLQSILQACAYHKSIPDKNGVIHKIALKDKDGNIVPVRKSSDGGEVGANRWSKDSPEEMFLRRACFWAEKMLQWQMEDKLVALDADFERVKTVITGDENILDFASTFTDEEVEKAALKYEKAVRGLKSWIKAVFGNKPPAFKGRKIWKMVREQLDHFIVMAKKIRSINEDNGEPINMEAIFSLAYNVGQNGKFEDGRWVEFSSGPMVTILKEIGGRLTSTKKKELSGWFRTIFWYEWQEMDSKNPKSSKLYCIKQYVFAMASLERLEALKERQGEVLGIDAPASLKTPWDAVFVREKGDWLRIEMDNWEYRKETQ